ncbi:MAG TPA: cytidine deaminase [Thermomicrobiales bacterium]|nr:cytidine deaminase [Thermomicrobiales bacterium]
MTTPPEDTVTMLIERAREAATHAYVPYSHFPVGAAVLTASGEVITGANIENASFGLTNCAERVALQLAAYHGHRDVVAVAVSAPRAAGTTPCGACRQVMNEFRPESGDMAVILDYFDARTVVTLAELLPRSFGPRDLDRAT